MKQYDVIVIGGGHAGIEASSAAARMGCRTALVTADVNAIGRLSCNPAVGGMAKGQLVCEIDALGGEMGRLADRSGIQFKMLGRSKGPAMWSPRSQNDKDLYPRYAQERLREIAGLDIIAGLVEDVRLENGAVAGVRLADGLAFACRTIVVCSGTFLCGRMHTGEIQTAGGRVGEFSVEHLSGSLREVGFVTGRLKTGTPPRVDAASVDFSLCQTDHGDPEPIPFSQSTSSVRNRIACYLTSTSEATHKILRTGFDRSPMFTGKITGTGPRYCPSIEDKIHRFSEKESHQIFLEPEGVETNSVYVNGFSTSLPRDVQLLGLRSIPPLERCEVLRYGYAVEYDYFPSYQLHLWLESKRVRGLFFAGQVNGTSGYEEAAAQGLLAGINAALSVRGEEPLIIDRSQGYIGVLIDDLVNLTILEPYRMFTSRAEYRLLLRRDNADLRLTDIGNRLGLVDGEQYARMAAKREGTEEARDLLQKIALKGRSDLAGEDRYVKGWQYLKRPEVVLADLLPLLPEHDRLQRLLANRDVAEQMEIQAKYEGYIKRQLEEVERFTASENVLIPEAIDYGRIQSLSSEAREKLSQVRPRSLGQASRIAGVSRSDVSVLSLYIR
ncbi:MAG: tRNA uridine-5-carboxymethylaminomethyl(34) synthesis enzyme MnmG [Bacteroidetes bacterium]|nr:tRNA uridine-5-carboxymethylaminomethyl(34) synthesis enzyme MnmG [Bacteroidota bacterium]